MKILLIVLSFCFTVGCFATEFLVSIPKYSRTCKEVKDSVREELRAQRYTSNYVRRYKAYVLSKLSVSNSRYLFFSNEKDCTDFLNRSKSRGF